MSSRLLGLVLLFLTSAAAAEEGGRLTVIEAARVITVTGEEYAPGQIVIEDGKITLVGSALEVPAGARRIRARRETVMPGLILARTRHGLVPFSRSGIRCDARAVDEIRPGEIDPRSLLRSGFMIAAFTPPRGTAFPGQASVVAVSGLDDRDRKPRVLQEGAYLPTSFASSSGGRQNLKAAFDKARKEIEKVDKAKKEWEKKQAEAKKKAEAEAKAKKEGEKKDGKDAPKDEKKEPPKFEPPKIDPTVAPLVDLLQKKKDALPLLIEIGGASNYRHLMQVLEDLEELKEKHAFQMIPSSRTEQRAIVEDLGKSKVFFITMPRLATLPQTRTLWNPAAELSRAGCKLILLPTGDTDLEYRRFRGRIAELIRSGLSRKDALKAITLHPAEFLGLKAHGAIEKDRAADLVFLDGDPFAAATEVTRVFEGDEIVWEREADR